MRTPPVSALLPILLAFSVYGCAVLPIIGAALSAGLHGVRYLKDIEVQKTLPSSLADVQEASRQALKDMDIPINQEEIDEDKVEIVAETPDLTITLKISAITSKTTKVTVKAVKGLFVDKATAMAIVDQVSLNLPLSVPSLFSRFRPSLFSSLFPSLFHSTSLGEGFTWPADLETRAAPLPFLPGPPSPLIAQPLKPQSEVPSAAQALEAPQPASPTHPPPKAEAAYKRALTPSPLASPLPSPDGGEALDPPEAIYQMALNDYVKGNFESAIKGFQSYLSRSPKTGRTPGAHYWLGEAYLGQRNYLQAILEFEMVIREYSQSGEVPRALLREAFSFRQLGEVAKAKSILLTLIKKFPRSREARRAQDVLAKGGKLEAVDGRLR